MLLGKFRSHFHDHVILVQRLVHDRDLALAEGVVQSVVNVRGSHAQPRGGVAIDDHGGFQTLVLLVGVDVAQFGKCAQLLQQKRRPVIQVIQIFALQRVLKLRLALAAADGQVLRGLHEEGCARHHCQLPAQSANHLISADLALGERLQRDEHAALVGRSVAAGKAHNGLNRRIFHHDVDKLRHLLLHRGERNILRGLYRTLSRPVSCCGKNPLGTMM